MIFDGLNGQEDGGKKVSEEQAATFIMGKQHDQVNMKFVTKTLDPVFRFNIFCAVFGFAYAMYRKSYAMGIFLLTLELGFLGSLNYEGFANVPLLNWIVAVVRFAVDGFLFFPFYHMKLKRVLNNFWKKAMVLSDEMEMKALEEQGGTNLILGILAGAAMVGVVFYINVLM